MVTKAEIKKALAKKSGRSAWEKGVIKYAKEIVDDGLESNVDYKKSELNRAMLNGARNWKQYSKGGFSLIYNEDIARRLCTPSEFKKTEKGAKMPNSREDWLDVQARALSQAAMLIQSLA